MTILKNCGFLFTLTLAAVSAPAQLVPVPNHSFELPRTEFAFPMVDSWQTTPKPDWYDEEQNGPWFQLVGVFKNSAPTEGDHIPNLEGDQALFLFNIPTAGVFQDYNSVGGTNAAPSHEFAARFEPGKSYVLTAGVLGGLGGMTNGASLLMSLYYRDSNGAPVTVAAQPIVHSTNLFRGNPLLIDFSLETAEVDPSDPWAGQHLGIMFVSTSGAETSGGYWDLDNVRLRAVEKIAIPNASFESPSTNVSPVVDAWQKTPKPDWYDENQNGPWSQLSGVFRNTDPGSADHIPNLHGDQALFLFNSPQAGIFQDVNSIGGTNAEPTGVFDATFEPGKAYTLALDAIGGGGGMPQGASLLMSLYYVGDDFMPVTVGSKSIVYSTNQFPGNTVAIETVLEVPAVQPTDPWAGQNLGIMIVSTSGFENAGGYWDLDNVRLYASSAVAGLTLAFERDGSNLGLSWPSQAGASYRLEVSQDLETWTEFEAAIVGTGAEISRSVPLNEFDHAFFRVIELP